MTNTGNMMQNINYLFFYLITEFPSDTLKKNLENNKVFDEKEIEVFYQ